MLEELVNNPEFIRHLEELRYRVIRVLYYFIFFFIFFLDFRINFTALSGVVIPYPYPDFFDNSGAQFLQLLEAHVLPHNAVLINVKPTDSIVADFYVCMFLSLIFSMPAIAYHAWRFIAPGLKPKETMTIRYIVLPATVLFLLGSFMGIWIVAPELFRIFNDFSIGLGALDSMTQLSFISFLLVYTLAFGLSFEVPVFMVALTRFGVVSSDYWSKNWRYAVVASLVFGMIFSPGVTGFTMVVMAAPMICLYFAGIYFARRTEKSTSVVASPD